MTKEEALEILKNSDDMKSYQRGNKICHAKIGGLYREFPDGFSFVVYPYSSENPVDPNYALEYCVDKKTKDVGPGSGQFSREELAEWERGAAGAEEQSGKEDTHERI